MLIVLLFGLSYVAKAYGVTAMDPDAHDYQSVLSIEVAAVFGRGWFYFLTMGGVLAALSFSANTAFAGFPRLARAIAMRDYLPHVFLLRGRRLLFYARHLCADGVDGAAPDRLRRRHRPADSAVCDWRVPGVYVEPGGMVRHWMKRKERAASRDQDVPERAGRGGDRHHAAGGAGGEVHVGCLDDGDPGAAADRDDAGDQAALRQRGGGGRRSDAAAAR